MQSNITNNIIWKLVNEPFYDRMNHLQRWQGHKTLMNESVSQHSYTVTLFARVLAEQIFPKEDIESRLKTSDYAMLHDFDEVITGDVNHSVKYNGKNGEEIRNQLQIYIDHVIKQRFDKRRAGEKFFVENINEEIPPYIKCIVKVADWLSMVVFLLGEKSSGNKSIIKEFEYCKRNVKEASKKTIEMLSLFYGDKYNENILLMLKNHDIV